MPPNIDTLKRREVRRDINRLLASYIRELEKSFSIPAEELLRIVSERLEARRNNLAAGTDSECPTR